MLLWPLRACSGFRSGAGVVLESFAMEWVLGGCPKCSDSEEARSIKGLRLTATFDQAHAKAFRDRHVVRKEKGMVGPSGFEPPTSTAPSWRATKLRYGPTL